MVICLLLYSMLRVSEQSDTQDYEHLEGPALLAFGDTAEPPETGWQSVAIPHEWTNAEADYSHGWYRFRLQLDEQPDKYAVYLWRLAMNAEVWVNGQFVGSGGQMSEPISRNWNRPLLFAVPRSIWKPGTNTVDIKLATYPGWGSMNGVIVGDWDMLNHEYSNRYRWQVSGTQISFAISLSAMLMGFTLWLVQRRTWLYLSFSFASLAAAMFCSNLFLQQVPLPPLLWSWLVHATLDWYSVSLAIFCHHLLGIDARLRNYAFIGFGCVATVAYGFYDFYDFLHHTVYFHAIAITMTNYSTVLAIWYSFRSPTLPYVGLAYSMVVLSALAFHDLLLDVAQGQNQWQDNVYLLNFGFPVILLTMMAVLTRQLIRSMNQEREAEKRIRSERERLYSDIHDDIGSKLLSMVYLAETDGQAKVAREALGEVRTLVHGALAEHDTLEGLLLSCEAEARKRCLEAGINLEWSTDVSSTEKLTEISAYHLQRVYRELVTNALKHTDTPSIVVHNQSNNGVLWVQVRDYGKGFEASMSNSGAGIGGIQKRIEEMSGQVEWFMSNPGCTVEFSLPTERKARLNEPAF